jgi:hypothetical protein
MGKDSSNTGHAKMGRVAAIALVVTLVLMLVIQQGFRLLTGRSLGLGLWRIKHLGLAILDHKSVIDLNHGAYTNVVFLHHSTGANLISQGRVRERFTEAGYDFWDHHYNQTGLSRPDGSKAGYSYRIPDDNTDPDGLADIFAQPVHALPLNALSGLLQHKVIVFKSCFPASSIVSDEQLEQYKEWYLGMRDTMDAHPDRVFVVMSPPPLNPVATTPEAAARARAFADWLTSPEYLDGHPNVYAFDFFDQLAEDDPAAQDYNMLRASYRDGEDSHPNQAANETVGPIFAKAVIAAARDYFEHRGIDTANE